jgi:hypothetical protein
MGSCNLSFGASGRNLPAGCIDAFERAVAKLPPAVGAEEAFPEALRRIGPVREWLAIFARADSGFHFSRSYAGNPSLGNLRSLDGFNFSYHASVHDDSYWTFLWVFFLWLGSHCDDGFFGTQFGSNRPATPELLYVQSGHLITAKFKPPEPPTALTETTELTSAKARHIINLSVPEFSVVHWREIEESM